MPIFGGGLRGLAGATSSSTLSSNPLVLSSFIGASKFIGSALGLAAAALGAGFAFAAAAAFFLAAAAAAAAFLSDLSYLVIFTVSFAALILFFFASIRGSMYF